MRIRHLTLRRKLPLLLGLSALLCVLAFGFVAYRVAHFVAIEASYTRIRSALGEIVTITELGAVQQLADLRNAVADPALAEALARPDAPPSPRLHSIFERLRGASGAVIAVELIGSDRRVIHRLAGTESTSSEAAFEMPREPVIGPMYQADTTLLFEASASVTAGDSTVGALRVTRRLGTPGANRRIVARLLGQEAVLLIGNRDGRLWHGTQAVEHPRMTGDPVRYRREGIVWRSASIPVGSTPWQYAVDLPERTVLAPARALIVPFVLGGAVVAVLVGLLGLRLSRGISQPLEDLTEAAEAIARGEREVSLAAINRGDEIGRLARAFGTMATSVQAVRDRLESEADARGGELRGAVDRLRDLHEELHRSERLAALGLLSGSVGHELRNPLSVMSNVVFLIDALPESSPRVKEYAALLREQIRLSDRIISDLLERARSTEPVRVRVEIPAMLDDLITRANVPPGIDVERGFGPPFPAVWIDRDRVGQVVWNLITNAVQAMDGRGRLSVTAQVANGRLRIEVRDTGKGIAEADLDRVFQPMYTTRPDGVGLGLAISREFARAEGGDLTVSSIEGAGTSLVLELPIGAPPEAEIPEAAETSERLTS